MNKESFYQILTENGLILSDVQKRQLHTYFKMLVEKNKVMNLTGITEENEVYEKHFYDSLLFTFNGDYAHKTLIDVGSGAGFPGLVLAICYPLLSVTLLEPLTKRCNFLNEVISELNLTNVVVINERAEDYAKNHREEYDYGVARAVARLNMLLELVIPFVNVGGYFIALKGKMGYQELDEAKKAMGILDVKLDKVQDVKLPSEDDSRQNLFIMKMKKTNLKYPRHYSKIKSKPL